MSRLRRLLVGRPENLAATVYGTIVVMGAIAAGAQDLDAGRLAAVVTATVLVLWIAHFYSDTLAESINRGRRLDLAELTHVARQELGILLAAVAPVTALVLGALGVLKETTAGWLAMAFGLATLAVQGFRYAGVERLGRAATVVSVALNVGLGLCIVALKAVVSH